MNEMSLTTQDGVILIRIMQRKAIQLNQIFNSTEWTPRKIDMILWTYGRQSDSAKVYAPVSKSTVTTPTPEKAISSDSSRVEAKVRGLGQYYPNGTERFEIHIAKSKAANLGHTIGSQTPVQLQIGFTTFSGVLRSTASNKYLWISAKVYDQEGNRITLVDALSNNGFVKNQSVELAVDSGKIHVMPMNN